MVVTTIAGINDGGAMLLARAIYGEYANPDLVDLGVLADYVVGGAWWPGHFKYAKVDWATQAGNVLLLRGLGRTYQAIADHYGVARERIRQVEARSLRYLRHPRRRALWERTS